MIDKIVILAAGKGTRMKELTREMPKHLLLVAGKPFLYYALTNIKRAGFKKVILVSGYKKEKMEEFTAEYKNEFNIKLVDQYRIAGVEKAGTAVPVECVKDLVVNENFVVANGDDIYATEDLAVMRSLDDKFNYVSGLRHKEPEHYGLLKTDENYFLERIIEKPVAEVDFDREKPMENLINIGLYKFTPEIFKAIDRIDISPRGEYEITDALTLLAQDKKVKIYVMKSYWHNFTKKEDISKMEKLIENKKL